MKFKNYKNLFFCIPVVAAMGSAPFMTNNQTNHYTVNLKTNSINLGSLINNTSINRPDPTSITQVDVDDCAKAIGAAFDKSTFKSAFEDTVLKATNITTDLNYSTVIGSAIKNATAKEKAKWSLMNLNVAITPSSGKLNPVTNSELNIMSRLGVVRYTSKNFFDFNTLPITKSGQTFTLVLTVFFAQFKAQVKSKNLEGLPLFPNPLFKQVISSLPDSDKIESRSYSIDTDKFNGTLYATQQDRDRSLKFYLINASDPSKSVPINEDHLQEVDSYAIAGEYLILSSTGNHNIIYLAKLADLDDSSDPFQQIAIPSGSNKIQKVSWTVNSKNQLTSLFAITNNTTLSPEMYFLPIVPGKPWNFLGSTPFKVSNLILPLMNIQAFQGFQGTVSLKSGPEKEYEFNFFMYYNSRHKEGQKILKISGELKQSATPTQNVPLEANANDSINKAFGNENSPATAINKNIFYRYKNKMIINGGPFADTGETVYFPTIAPNTTLADINNNFATKDMGINKIKSLALSANPTKTTRAYVLSEKTPSTLTLSTLLYSNFNGSSADIFTSTVSQYSPSSPTGFFPGDTIRFISYMIQTNSRDLNLQVNTGFYRYQFQI